MHPTFYRSTFYKLTDKITENFECEEKEGQLCTYGELYGIFTHGEMFSANV